MEEGGGLIFKLINFPAICKDLRVLQIPKFLIEAVTDKPF